MTSTDIIRIRLANQQLAGTNFKNAKDLVGWMGAIQAQDFAMSKWAVGVRLPGSTNKTVQTAIDNGEIIRTHVLRPTWHLVSADDVYWMLELTGSRVKAFMKSNMKHLELSEDLCSKSNDVMAKALNGNNHLTREEIMAELKKTNINTNDLRGLHLLMHAELDGIICSGTTRNKNQTYALLSERVPKPSSIHKDEALIKLAKIYFMSHGPATLTDFAWWSGLSVTEAKHALKMIGPGFVAETIGTQTYWMSNAITIPETGKKPVYLLPAFDEFLISYKDRSAAITLELQSRAFTTNGIFKPIIVTNGQVAGTWKRTINSDKIIIETSFFKPPTKASKKAIEKAAKTFGQFLDKKTAVL
jgi:hypothetical protein